MNSRLLLSCSWLCGLVLATALAGCSNTGRRVPVWPEPDSNLIFNPSWAGLEGYAAIRADWPATVAYNRSAEIVDYTTTVIDRQGRFGHGNDFYIRRYHAIRRGQVVR